MTMLDGDRTLDRNALHLDILVSTHFGAKCGNCQIPLDSKANYRIVFCGDVCELCFTMHAAVNRTHFLDAHAEWEAENKKRRDLGRKRD